jgi:hypothetical protein
MPPVAMCWNVIFSATSESGWNVCLSSRVTCLLGLETRREYSCYRDGCSVEPGDALCGKDVVVRRG